MASNGPASATAFAQSSLPKSSDNVVTCLPANFARHAANIGSEKSANTPAARGYFSKTAAPSTPLPHPRSRNRRTGCRRVASNRSITSICVCANGSAPRTPVKNWLTTFPDFQTSSFNFILSNLLNYPSTLNLNNFIAHRLQSFLFCLAVEVKPLQDDCLKYQ